MMGEAYVRGHQADNNANALKKTGAAASLKHYVGYSFPFNGLDRTNALIPDHQLREVYLPPFERAVAAGGLTVMLNSASVNGIPVHASSYYVNDILKGELGFKGFVVSDWQDIIRLHTRDRVAETPREAVRLAVMAGVDMSMVPTDFSFYEHCVSLAKSDTAFARRVDDAAMRILSVKDKLGLFDNPFASANDLASVGRQSSQDFNLEAARESIVLGKNQNGVLPLKLGSLGRVLVTGPAANLSSSLNGGWSYSWQGDNEEMLHRYGRKKYSVFQALEKAASGFTFMQGSSTCLFILYNIIKICFI